MIVSIAALLSLSGVLRAQSITLSGKVVDPDGIGVIGAGVVCQGGKTTGTVTDFDGNFSLTIPAGTASVTVSALGMETLEYAVTEKHSDLVIVLKYESIALDQVVVTGYAQTTTKRITGSVGIISSEKFEAKPLASVSALMQGEIAGVQVQATSGQPGTQSRIRIRGTSNFSGSGNPLWVVDGVPLQSDVPNLSSEELAAGGFDNIFVNGVGNINPNDIESITILKDAAAAAIYGSRASNGVIVVQTKRGQAGRMKINYSNNFTVSFRPHNSLQLMSSSEKLAWEQELWDEFSAASYAKSATDPSVFYPIVGVVGQIRAGVGPFASMKDDKSAQDAYIATLSKTNTDWYGQLFRNAFSHNHHLSLSGGSDKCAYYISAGFNDDNGMLVHNNYKRYNLNSSVTITPIDIVKLDVGYDFSYQKSVSPESGVDAFRYAYFANPYEKPYEADGSYAPDNTWFTLGYYNGRASELVMPTNGFNILRELALNSSTTSNMSNTIRGQVDIRIIPCLKFVGLASFTHASGSTDRIIEKSTYAAFRDRLGYDDKSTTKLYGNITQNRSTRTSFVARGHFAFNKTFADIHTLNVIAGAEIRGAASNTTFTKRYNYNPITGTTSMPSISGPQDEWVKEVERLSGEYFTKSRYASFYASADYFLSDRYVFNASFRTDGSSNFGSRRQFNPTWSVGAAWHMKEEPWMKDVDAISHATIRAAYGYTGDVNTNAPHYLVMQYALQEYRYVGSDAYMLGSIPTAPNPDLGWEKTSDTKFGFDMGFLKDRLTVSSELYHRLSTDVVTSSQTSSATGYTYVYYNSADLMNFGIEATVSGKIVRKKGWTLDASVNFAYNYNKVLRYSPASKTITSRDRYVQGYPVGAIIAGWLDGIDPKTGLYQFAIREDSVINKKEEFSYSDNYRYYLGTTIAPFTGGFNLALGWKMLRLSISGVYSFGNKVYERIESPASYLNARRSGASTETVQSQYSDLYSNHLNVKKDRTDRWTASNTEAVKYPRIYDYYGKKYNFSIDNPMDFSVVDAIYLKNVSYLRIKTILLSCSLPKKWIQKAKMSRLDINASLNNFITITGYDGMDPEVPGATYPTTRSMSFGLNIGF